MRLITVFSLEKTPQIRLKMDQAGKGTQYKLIECCQFTTKHGEGKVNKYCEYPNVWRFFNLSFFILQNGTRESLVIFLYFIIYSTQKITLTANCDVILYPQLQS